MEEAETRVLVALVALFQMVSVHGHSDARPQMFFDVGQLTKRLRQILEA